MENEVKENRELYKVAWRFLSLLRTPKGAKYRLIESGRTLSNLNERSETLSVIVDAAHESYQDYRSSSSIIALYYMAFKLLQALLVATSPSIYSLKQLQNSSKYGHGIKMILQDDEHFPKGILFWFTRQGMFSDLMRLKGWTDSFIRLERNNDIDNLLSSGDRRAFETNNVFSTTDLLVRIPELRTYLYELQIGKPHYYHTGQPPGITDPGADITITTDEWKHYSLRAIKQSISSINRPTAVYNELRGDLLKFSPSPEKVFHYEEHIEIPLYNYWIKNLGKINNLLPVYFTLLYIFSILVRYFPLEWSRMTNGKNSVIPLVDAFSEYALGGITTWTCNEIFGKNMIV